MSPETANLEGKKLSLKAVLFTKIQQCLLKIKKYSDFSWIHLFTLLLHLKIKIQVPYIFLSIRKIWNAIAVLCDSIYYMLWVCHYMLWFRHYTLFLYDNSSLLLSLFFMITFLYDDEVKFPVLQYSHLVYFGSPVFYNSPVFM